ncbi:MAG: 2TM domain-containing protein [Spirochaetales bacterium]|nr:2TM domain-containing protein [Spirochaetales bacterium]
MEKQIENRPADRNVGAAGDYNLQLEQHADGARLAFKTHLLAFACVNGLLFFLWAFLTRHHPWFLYPLGAWGIGIAHHYTHLRNTVFKSRYIKKFTGLGKKGLSAFHRFCASRGAFRQHATAAASVSGYLFMINAITGVRFQWWLIPAAVLAMGLSIHALPHFAKLARLKKRLLSEAGVRQPSSGARNNELQEAQELEQGIRKALSSGGLIIQEQAAEILPVLEGYVRSIGELARKKVEIEEVLRAHPLSSITGQIREVTDRQAAAASETLRIEYGKTLQTLSRHEQSVRKLEERREIITLRLDSSVQGLRHLQLEIARLKTSELENALEQATLEELRKASEELSVYVEDADKGFSSLE